MKFKPSGSLTAASDKLFDKAQRVWFSISNIIYQNKRLSVDSGLKLFDSLIAPICTYFCELWTMFSLPAKSLSSLDTVLKTWETFKSEKLNHKVCNYLLSVHSKSSRLAVLGEISRYPLLVQAMSHSLVYDWVLQNKTFQSSWAGLAIKEMDQLGASGFDCWTKRINQIKKLFCIPNIPNCVKSIIKRQIRSKFDIFC